MSYRGIVVHNFPVTTSRHPENKNEVFVAQEESVKAFEASSLVGSYQVQFSLFEDKR